MYRKFYGLSQKPFALVPMGGLVYLSHSHREAIARLRYGVLADKGFLVLTGGVGVGKTTMLNTLLVILDIVKEKIQICVLNNPKLTRREFYFLMADKLGLAQGKKNKAEFIIQFTKLLQKHKKDSSKLLLIFDEAQVFSIELFEEIRLLSNLAEAGNVLAIFLVGQPELQQKLLHPRLLPLRQRIGVNYHLEALGREDTSQYIAYRLNKAGAVNAALFSSEAVDCIHEASQGNPRLINVICDYALITGFFAEKKQIDREMVLDSINELRLKGEDRLQTSNDSGLSGKPYQGRSYARTPLKTAIYVLVPLVLAISGGLFFYFSL